MLLKFDNLAVGGEYLQKEFKSHLKASEGKEVSSFYVNNSYCQCNIMLFHL